MTLQTTGIRVQGNVGHTLQANDTATGSVTIDWNDGPSRRLTLTGNVTLSFTDLVAAAGDSLIGTIKLVMGGSGSYTITWSDVDTWIGGSAPNIAGIPVTDGIYVQILWDGSEYVGLFTGQFVS